MAALSLIKRAQEQEIFSAVSIMGLRVSMLASKFFLALFIVRFLGLESMGIFGLVTGAAAIVPMAMRFGIFSSLARLAVNQPLEDLTHNLRHYAAGVTIIYLLVCLPVLALSWHYGVTLLALLCILVIYFEHSGNDIFVMANNLGWSKLANVMLSLQTSLWIYIYMAAAFFYPSLRTLEWVFGFWIAGGIVTAVTALFLTRKWPWFAPSHAPLSRRWYFGHFKNSWRIYISEILSSSTIYLDRYLIGFFLTLEMVGVYVLFWQVTNAICNLVGAGILQLYVPRLVAAHKSADGTLFRTLFLQSARKSLLAAAVLAVAAGAIVPFLVSFTKQPTAMDYLPLLWMMLFAVLFRVGADIYSYTLYARHRDDLVLKCTILKIATALTVGAGMLNVLHIYGTVPAVIATNLSMVIYLALRKEKIAG